MILSCTNREGISCTNREGIFRNIKFVHKGGFGYWTQFNCLILLLGFWNETFFRDDWIQNFRLFAWFYAGYWQPKLSYNVAVHVNFKLL